MSKKSHETATKLRILLIQREILNSVYGITRKHLIDKYNVNYSTIKRDFETLESAGYFLDKDSMHRYKFRKGYEHKQLKELLHFSEEEQILLHEAIDHISPQTRRAKILKKKLASLYDYRKLGLEYLSLPYMQKINNLQKAMDAKTGVILENYQSSNSNIIADRYVEPFHIDTYEDILYAFDIDKKELRNFKISRIGRIKSTNNKWENEKLHNILHTDPFRIVDRKMTPVHLIITLAGKNYLEEIYPVTRTYITQTQKKGIYNFQCTVNHRFIGLDNFILGYHREIVEIISPESLKTHIIKSLEEIKKIEGIEEIS